ncbi:MAG: sn-glycerol-3-phosphate ABC transporter permease UgpA [Candidatus Bipolaricaulaceae bacterium]
MHRGPLFKNKLLPYLFVLPQLVLVGLFFFWPATVALYQSVLRTDPFGLRTRYVGLANFRALFADPHYLQSIRLSFGFSLAVAAGAMTLALLFAVMANKRIAGARVYRTLFVWPYAVAPATAAVLWLFMFQPQIGIVARWLKALGMSWDYRLNGGQALFLVTIASVWKQISYNFIFFLAGLQSIPSSLVEAAAVDGAKPRTIFWRITFPLLTPTTFFLLIMNLVYSFFDTFGVIDALTRGGPGKATETLAYRAYIDGMVNLNIGSSAAQSVILLVIVIIVTLFQFKLVERRVYYG